MKIESMVKGKSSLPEAPNRWYCEECNEVSETLLVAPNPFDKSDTLVGCPKCLCAESMISACWKCNRPAGIGTSDCDEYRYIQTCHKHMPKKTPD